MKTKFIGLDGFGEIETLRTTRKVKKHYGKRTVRFFKQAVQVTYCLAKSFEKPKQRVKMKTPTLDACYRNARMGNNEFSVKILDFSRIPKKQDKKKAYSVKYTRDFQPISTNFIKHKATLGAMTACVAGTFAVLTVFSAAGVNSNATENNLAETKTALVSQSLSRNGYENSFTYAGIATDDSVAPVDSDLLDEVASAMTNVQSKIVGLYIDGEFIGAVSDEAELYKVLDDFLEAAKEDFDDSTKTEYVNKIEVRPGEYEFSEIVPLSELIEKLSGAVQISLTTEMYYEREIQYDTEIEYDDSQDTNYREVKQEGKAGIEKVICNVTFTDGIQTDSVEIDSEVIEEPVNEIVVVGTQEAAKEVMAEASSTGSFIWPVPNTHNITSGYGYRWGRTHSGLDISNGVTDEAIVASDGGTVVWAGYDNSGYGNYIIIDHGNGYQTLYGHCNSLYVSVGEYVYQGQTIAGMGTTGDSTGTHLHFEIRQGSTRLDPSGFVW